jgi:hypothetical protein
MLTIITFIVKFEIFNPMKPLNAEMFELPIYLLMHHVLKFGSYFNGVGWWPIAQLAWDWSWLKQTTQDLQIY